MFNELNSVENFIRDVLCGKQAGRVVRETGAPYTAAEAALAAAGLGWRYVPADRLPRRPHEVLVEAYLRQALIRLNPEIAARPERADEVIYKLRAILLTVGSAGLVGANEAFTEWMRGEKTMPFGPGNEHTPVRLIDFDDLGNNDFAVTTQYVLQPSPGIHRRLDLVLLMNGLPLVIGEAKTPTRPAISWVDGAAQIQDDYEANVPGVFVPNVFSFATEGKEFYYGSIQLPLEKWSPWRAGGQGAGEQGGRGAGVSGLREVERAARGLLRPEMVLDMLQYFTLFATDKKHRKIKVIGRYQQVQAANQIVERVTAGTPRKGLIWHFQGSGKSLLMLFAANKLRLHPALKNPTVVVVVDRVDLDTQITATFNAADVPNLVPAESREELQRLLAQDVRKVIITTIHKFAEAGGVLNRRENIIVMVDEAHRTQEGDLGRQMRQALPNAFLFGLTGTPINKRDRNTFWAFGAEEDSGGYLSRYSFEESIRDKATLPLHFEARLVELRVEQEAIDEAYANITGHLSESDQENLARMAAKMAVLVKAPERVQAIAADIANHFRDRVEPQGFKGQMVAFDREACVLYKQALDQFLPPEASTVVMTTAQGDDRAWKQYDRNKEEEERLLDRFRDPADPLKLLIVTAKLLTGFDAPILQVMYLDKPMKEHNLLQAICRTNRPYPGKTHGLIVDYIGVFDDVSQALDFDEKSVQQVISNLEALAGQLPGAVAACLAYFPGVDRTASGYEGLLAAQECLPDNDTRDAFAADYSVLLRLWEALSPRPLLNQYRDDYKWLTQVHESVRPPSGQGKLLWHALGGKTLELIHENIHVAAMRDDLETLVMDAEFLEEVVKAPDPAAKAQEIEFKISRRLQKHRDDPRFVKLGQRLEELKERLEAGILNSVEYLKLLLDLARDIVRAEKNVDPEEERRTAKAALTELFEETRNHETPVIVERVVNDIDEIVRIVRFPGWQDTNAGEREVKKALRRTLLKYQLHKDQDLFDRAYEYIRQYY
ncbi:MAG: HsdR family type I site-specific deoxyribonuclease [Chloroflexi bacterium]|nr:HsdR family type I site-specific deoxyribonuclease [Chloroflexota bacterium]MCI0644215.1 HsdR family type I site-specific deoxyribonuclease [Chloroflexota bacterium]MCI0730819.1 HsdR family type I site-specific deoxyribonuclease [Chloroflexota bacterium]